MNIWIVILIFGLACIVIGFGLLFKNLVAFRRKRPALLIGIFLPIILAYSYAEDLINYFPMNVTLVDLGGLFLSGIISGIFISFYFFDTKNLNTRQ